MLRATSMGVSFLAALGAVFAASSASAETVMHGRISATDQSGLVKGTDDSDWSYAGVNSLVMPGDTVWADDESALEIEFSSGIFLRLADGSKLDVIEAPPSALFRGTTGSFYVQRVRRSSGDVSFDTPVGAIDVSPDTQVRIDILEEGATTVTVRWGQATIHSEGGAPVVLRAGERSLIDPGFLPSAPVVFERNQEDAFDTWNRSRARTIAEGSLPTPIQSSYSGGVAPMGVSDLNGNGEWVYVDNTPYWRPTVVNYVPYRQGSWSYVPAQGYVWVDYYPWAYTTTHYGHWRYTSRYGWCWGYAGAYRPAYAYTVRYGGSFIWAPMDVYGYPVHYGSYASFSIGNVQFSLGFSSYAYDYAVFGGGYHSVYGVDYHHIYNDHHHHHYNSCDYWRIDSDRSPYRNAGKPHWPGDRVNTFAPERVYRGATVASDGTTRARDRAKTLETRQAERTNSGAPVRLARATKDAPTAPSARREATRQVRIAEPGSTRVARVPDTSKVSNGGEKGARGRTYGNDEARGSAPLSRGSMAERPTAPSERTKQDAAPRERNSRGPTTPGAVKEPSSGQSRTITTLPPTRARSNTPTPDGKVQDNPGDRSRPSAPRTTRTGRPADTVAPDIGQQFPAERPRPTTTRRSVEPSNQPSINRPAPNRGRGNDNLPEVVRPQPSERPRVTTTRPQVAEAPRPEVIRPQQSDRRESIARPPRAPESAYQSAPKPQISRPEIQRPSYDRQQQAPRTEIQQPSYERQQQVARPQVQQPSYERQQQFSRPEPQRAPQSAQVPQPLAPSSGSGAERSKGAQGRSR